MLDTVLATSASLVLGVLVIEIGGYFWHRWVEHEGLFGKAMVASHVRHHEKDYPTDKLRPNSRYKSAKSWSWYVMGVGAAAIIFVLVPRPYSLIAITTSVVYAKFVTSYLHKAFHVPTHWLQRFGWFKRLTYLHDIHHYKPVNFGITSFFMDRIFGTFSATMPAKAVSTFRYAHDRNT